MEKHYAFLKNNRVVSIAVFSEENTELANLIVQQQGYDNAIWVGDNQPTLWSTYNGTTFTPPTKEYLISIGVLTPTEDN